MAPDLKPEIRAYYDKALEIGRLQQGPFRLERARTQELLRRVLPPPPAVVLDVGGGPGDYALWLADLGYAVHLLDPITGHVAHAEARSREAANPLAGCRVGDARALPYADASAGAVLMLGPLYHLTDAADRQQALREAARVLVPGGCLAAAAISRFASTLAGLAQDLFADPAFGPIAAQDLQDGIHRNPTGRLDFFTTAYFHRPDALEAEVRAAGFGTVAVYGIEGPGWLFPDFDVRWADDRRREDLLRVARMVEQEPALRGASAHLLAVAS
jgi:ubiquinone/menaquinone biosynthesis C-methylase UbiE